MRPWRLRHDPTASRGEDPIAAHQAQLEAPLTTATLVVNGERIGVRDDTDTRQLIGELLNAVNAGGGVVTVAGRHGQTFEVIVTPMTQAMICHSPPPRGATGIDGPWVFTVNLDY